MTDQTLTDLRLTLAKAKHDINIALDVTDTVIQESGYPEGEECFEMVRQKQALQRVWNSVSDAENFCARLL